MSLPTPPPGPAPSSTPPAPSNSATVPSAPGAGGFAYPRAEIDTAARAATSAADRARGIDPGGPVRELAVVLPGARSARSGEELAVSWQRGMAGWCDDLARHAQALLGSSAAVSGTDTDAAGGLGRTLFGGVLEPGPGR